MREIRTSGSVRGEEGNLLAYSTWGEDRATMVLPHGDRRASKPNFPCISYHRGGRWTRAARADMLHTCQFLLGKDTMVGSH